MSVLTLPAIKFTQCKVDMFLCVPTMAHLLPRYKIDTWKPLFKEEGKSQKEILTGQGYQRKPSASRVKKVAKYALAPGAIFPASIIVSPRSEVHFVPMAQGERVGQIHLANDEPLYIIDGQHRLEGLNYAITELRVEELIEFELPITIIPKLTKKEEIEQFVLINRTQKRVPTNLGDRLLEYLARFGGSKPGVNVLEQKAWKSNAVRIAERVNRDSDSPWFGRIIRPNAPRTDSAVAGESEFTKSLKNYLTSPYGDRPDEERVYQDFNNYWKAFSQIMPEAFEEPANYVIQKTAGFHSLNPNLPIVLRECADEFGRNCTVGNLVKILRRVEDDKLEATWWESGNVDGAASYVGMGPIGELSREFAEDIQSI